MAESTLLTCTLRHGVGSLTIDVDFCLTEPWTMLFGPSGSGKSTILRAIAGFVRPESGRIVAGGRKGPLLDTGRRIQLPPHERPVRFAPQAARMIPHETVLRNLRYGLAPGLAESSAGEMVTEVVALFRLGELMERTADQLSGGEMQRVAVARAVLAAISREGTLLLLDEPFAGLDAVLRDDLAVRLRGFLRRRKTFVLSVSHDVVEAYLLEAEVIRITDGRVTEQGPVARVLAGERDRALRQLRG